MSELRLRLLVAKRASGSYLLAAYQNYIHGGVSRNINLVNLLLSLHNEPSSVIEDIYPDTLLSQAKGIARTPEHEMSDTIPEGTKSGQHAARNSPSQC